MMTGSGEHVPIYQKLTDFYSRRISIQEYQPGSKIDSISRIMERHTVSRETAKLVLRRLIEKELVVSVQGKGTFVHEINETKRHWGVVVPFFSSNVEQLIGELTFEAEKTKRRLHYYLHYNNHDEEIRITGNLIQSGYEAVIVLPNYDESLTAGYYRRVMSGKSKLILADNTMAGSFFNYVIQSYDLGVKRAFDYLSQRDNGNYLLLGNEIWRGQNMVFDLMESTFRMLIQQSCPERKLLVKNGLREIDAAFVRTNKITGILSVQDSDSVRMLGRLKEWGIAVPEQVSLVSYGNTELTKYFSPGITAIDCNFRVMAQTIGRFISGKVQEKNRQVVISPEIIVRNT